MKVSVVETYSQDTWNATAPHPLVSWEWGEARKAMGIDVLRIAEHNGDSLHDVFQITFHKIPYTAFTIGYMPRTRVPSVDTLEVIRQEAKRRNSLFIKIEPYVKKGAEGPHYENFLKRTQKSDHPLFPEWTQMLDLTRSEDELLKNMKPKWRYNIKLAEKKGVRVQEMTSEEGFKIFSQLYFQTTDRQKYRGHNQTYHHTIFKTLKDTMSHILIAFLHDEPLSAYHLFLFNRTLYYPYGGSSQQNRDVMASNLLMWEAIKFGKKHGAKVFDLWGSLAPDYSEDTGGWAGFTRFKEGFGTDFVELAGSFDYVLNPAAFKLYSVAYQLRKFIL